MSTPTTPLLGLERKIMAADLRGIVERWRYGRRLLHDRKLTTTSGQLRPGVAESLVNAARSAGYTLSEQEIERRLQCARVYAAEPELRRAAAAHEGWTSLVDADFPSVETVGADDDRGMPDGREATVGTHPEPWEQPALDGGDGSLFPRVIRIGGAALDRDSCTLMTLAAFLAGLERWADAHTRRNAERRRHLDELIEACGGDLNVQYGAAVQRLREEVRKG
jgi:hypothetical protein